MGLIATLNGLGSRSLAATVPLPASMTVTPDSSLVT